MLTQAEARDSLALMLKLQDQINSHIHQDWRSQQFPWYRAIWLECSELIEHLDWKWWKHGGECDRRQVQLEVVDIWHFGLSDLLATGNDDPAELCDSFICADNTGGDWQQQRICRAAEELAAAVLQSRRFELAAFVELVNAVALTYEELHTWYVGKNVLNRFRRDYGYNEGRYVKNWNGKEDNEHLASLLEQYGTAGDFREQLYAALQQIYPGSRS